MTWPTKALSDDVDEEGVLPQCSSSYGTVESVDRGQEDVNLTSSLKRRHCLMVRMPSIAWTLVRMLHHQQKKVKTKSAIGALHESEKVK